MDVAVGAVQVGGEAPCGAKCRGFARGRVVIQNGINVDLSLADAQCGLERIHQARLVSGGKTRPVLHHLEQRPGARMNARIALVAEHLLYFGFAEIGGYADREGDDKARVAGEGGARLERRVNGFGRIAPHRLATAAAVQAGGAREQQLQVVVEFGHGAHGRA